MVAARRAWRLTPARAASIERARAARAERVKARHAAQERAGGTCKVVAAGVDTLNLTSRAELRSDVAAELLAMKEEAVKARRDDSAAVLPRWRSNALKADLEVQPYGSRKGAIVATSEAVVLVLNPTGPRNLPRAYVELKAPFLWSGWEHASDVACELLREVSSTDARLDVQVSRLDLAVDFMGWIPEPELLDQVVGRVVRRNANWVEQHNTGRVFTGFTFGGGQLLARLYDKTVELRLSKKTWFETIWKRAGWVDEETSGHVWRLEFQIRREPLRQAECAALDESREMKSWADVRRGLNELWRYLTKKWLTYRLPRTGRERVRLHPRWVKLMDARFTDQPFGKLYRHMESTNFERCTGALAGYLVREVSMGWKHNKRSPNEERLREDLHGLVDAAMKHYELKRGPFFENARARWRRARDFEALFGRAEPATPARPRSR